MGVVSKAENIDAEADRMHNEELSMAYSSASHAACSEILGEFQDHCAMNTELEPFTYAQERNVVDVEMPCKKYGIWSQQRVATAKKAMMTNLICSKRWRGPQLDCIVELDETSTPRGTAANVDEDAKGEGIFFFKGDTRDISLKATAELLREICAIEKEWQTQAALMPHIEAMRQSPPISTSSSPTPVMESSFLPALTAALGGSLLSSESTTAALAVCKPEALEGGVEAPFKVASTEGDVQATEHEQRPDNLRGDISGESLLTNANSLDLIRKDTRPKSFLTNSNSLNMIADPNPARSTSVSCTSLASLSRSALSREKRNSDPLPRVSNQSSDTPGPPISCVKASSTPQNIRLNRSCVLKSRSLSPSQLEHTTQRAGPPCPVSRKCHQPQTGVMRRCMSPDTGGIGGAAKGKSRVIPSPSFVCNTYTAPKTLLTSRSVRSPSLRDGFKKEGYCCSQNVVPVLPLQRRTGH